MCFAVNTALMCADVFIVLSFSRQGDHYFCKSLNNYDGKRKKRERGRREGVGFVFGSCCRNDDEQEESETELNVVLKTGAGGCLEAKSDVVSGRPRADSSRYPPGGSQVDVLCITFVKTTAVLSCSIYRVFRCFLVLFS